MNPIASIWYGVDPLTGKYPYVSGYIYCIGNPIKLIDADGKDWFVNYQCFYLWSNKSHVPGFTYYGKTLPNDVSHYYILENIDGVLYHKYTTNIPRKVINKLFGTNLVEKKLYDAAWESASPEIENTTVAVASGGLAKLSGLGKVISQIRWLRGLSDKSTFIKSALRNDRNGLSQIGRALQKHAGRANSSFSDIRFSGRTATEDGMKILRDIMRSKNKVVDIEANGTKTVYDKVSGRGFNISREGKFNEFRDFKERTK